MDNAQETLEQFEKLVGGEGIADIVYMAYREGLNDGLDILITDTETEAHWDRSASKERLRNLLTKLAKWG